MRLITFKPRKKGAVSTSAWRGGGDSTRCLGYALSLRARSRATNIRKAGALASRWGWNSWGCSICAHAIGGDRGSWGWNYRGLLTYASTLWMAVGTGESIMMWQCISRRWWLTSTVAITGPSRSCRIVWQAGGQSRSGESFVMVRARLIFLTGFGCSELVKQIFFLQESNEL